MITTLLIGTLLGLGPAETEPGNKPLPAPRTAPVMIQLKEEAICRGLQIELRDIASIMTADTRLLAQLRRVSLGLPPSTGYIRKITPYLVRKALAGAGLKVPGLRIAGADRTIVESRTYKIDSDQVVRAADRVLRAAVDRIADEDIETTLLSRPPHQVVPAGRMGVDLNARLRRGKLGTNQALVDVTIMVDGAAATRVTVGYTLRRMREVLVILSTVRKGQPLTKSNTGLKRIDITNLTTPPILRYADIEGKVAVRTLYNGRPVTRLDLKEPDAVKRGEVVTIVGRSGVLTITMKGIARAAGAVGDRITVTNIQSKKPVRVRIAGPGVVEVF